MISYETVRMIWVEKSFILLLNFLGFNNFSLHLLYLCIKSMAFVAFTPFPFQADVKITVASL